MGKHAIEPLCEKCGEDRLVEEVTDTRGRQLVCKVCCWSKWLDRQGDQK